MKNNDSNWDSQTLIPLPGKQTQNLMSSIFFFCEIYNNNEFYKDQISIIFIMNMLLWLSVISLLDW